MGLPCGEFWDRKEATFYLPNGSINTIEMLCASPHNCCSFSFAVSSFFVIFGIHSWDFYGNLVCQEMSQLEVVTIMWSLVHWAHHPNGPSSFLYTTSFAFEVFCCWLFRCALSQYRVYRTVAISSSSFSSSFSHSLYLLFISCVFSSCHVSKSKPNWHHIEAYLLHKQFVFQSM